ncbi:MAG: alpha/beta hydrolase-fold protein [Planctomycetota bacterium]
MNAEDYRHGPDSIRKPDVPKGTVTAHRLENSSVFEGTQRRYNVYVPAQYDGSQPAALMVFQDGHAFVKETGDFRVPIVFDNLIASGDMPITIAVMVDPGNRGRLPEKRGWNQGTNNRSVEYDTVSPAYGDFLIQDLLPVIAKDYKLTTNPDLRAICGNSSGGICAFGVAWHHPDSFRKVLSHIGSFVDIRGGHNYPPMIRKQDKRPLRVFLQDGENDLDNRFGNWPLANRQMAKALAYRDYDYKLVFGDGKHNGKHAGTIFPESLKWLWRDWETLAP